jgi:hypothetical protein
MLAGWKGAAHDATILADSLKRVDRLKFSKGKFYLANVGYACRPGFLPHFRSTRYHLNEFSARFYPKNAKEFFNIRHSSLRVTVERAFAALNNRFKILDQKLFHTFSTQVNLVMACCILHNWILGWVIDSVFPNENEFQPGEVDVGHGVAATDNTTWKNKRREWTDAV